MNLLALLFAIAPLVCPQVADCSEVSPTKAAAPIPEEQARIETQIRDIFAEDLSARSPFARLAAARKFLDEAEKSDSDQVARFVLLQHARDSAISAGNATLAWKAVCRLAREYRIDSGTLKTDALIALNSQTLDSKEAEVAAEHGFHSIELAIAKDDFATAARLGPTAEAMANRSHNAGLVEAIHKEVVSGRVLAAQYSHVRRALDILKVHPDDASSGEVVGRYLCMSKGDWNGGLTLLAKSDDRALRQIAMLELTSPSAAKDQKELADQWWGFAEKFTLSDKIATRRHASDWYRKVVGGLSGIEKAVSRKRQAEIPEQPLYPVDLLSLIDLNRDVVEGTWELKGGILSNNASGICRLRIPYEPPEEYDFIIEFTRPGGRDQVWQVFPIADSQLVWSMGSWGRDLFLAEATGFLVKLSDPSCCASGVKFSAVVRVRHLGVRVILNGKDVAGSEGPFDNLPAQQSYALPSGKALGIGAWKGAPALFSKVEIIPLTRYGHSLAMDDE